MKRFGKLLAVAVAAVYATSAYGIATMTISDGVGAPIVVTDNGAGDTSALVGRITFDGSVGVWSIIVNTGLSKPILGSATQPHMDLNYTVVSTGAGTLTITFSDDGFNYTGPITDHWGGTTSSIGTGNQSLNRVFENTELVASAGPFGNGSFSSTTGGSVSLTPTDTLSLVVELRHTTGGNSSGDKEVNAIPDGGMTLVLLGSSLAALALFRRKNSIRN